MIQFPVFLCLLCPATLNLIISFCVCKVDKKMGKKWGKNGGENKVSLFFSVFSSSSFSPAPLHMCPPSMSSPLLRSRMASGTAASASSSGAAAPAAAAAAAQASRNLRSVAAAAAATSSGSQQPPRPPQKRKRSLVARLGQSFNPSGIALFGKILLVSRLSSLNGRRKALEPRTEKKKKLNLDLRPQKKLKNTRPPPPPRCCSRTSPSATSPVSTGGPWPTRASRLPSSTRTTL